MESTETEDKPLTVEQHLDAVVYDPDDTSYVPSVFAVGFVQFIKLVNGEKGEENTTPVAHYKMLDQLCSADPELTDVANLCSRGLAKSCLFAEYLFLYIAVYGEIPGYGKIRYALYVSDSIDNGVKKMRRRIEGRRKNSPFLMKVIPNIRFTDIAWLFENSAGTEFMVSAHGAKTGVRGTVELNMRPQLAVLDDLISDADARSQTVISAVEDTVYNAVDYALHPTMRKTVWSGTPFNAADPLYKAIESGAWAVNVFPVCEKFPCTREEFRSAWADRFNYDFVYAKYNKAKKTDRLHSFYQELMLRIMNEEDQLVRPNDLVWYQRNELLKHRQNFNFYITSDFATSANRAADYSTCFVWALNHIGQWYWVDGFCQRQEMGENVDQLFDFVRLYKPQEVGIEVSGQQGGFVSWINREMLSRNCYFNWASDNNSNKPGIRPISDKMSRFLMILPQFKQHNILFPSELEHTPEMTEILEELRLATRKGFKSLHDDAIDSISMLTSLNIWLPSAPTDTSEFNPDSGLWEDEDDEDDFEHINERYL